MEEGYRCAYFAFRPRGRVMSRPRKVVMLGRGGKEGEERSARRKGEGRERLGPPRQSYFFICASF